MMRQTEKWFTDRFFDLFFPAEGFGGYSCRLPEKLSFNSELTIVVCGAGAGVLEATIAKDLCRKASKINIAFIDISDEPLSMLHWILQHHKESKKQLRTVFDAGGYPRIELEKMYHTSMWGCQINYAFFIENLELNPNPQNQNFILEDISPKSIRGSFNDFLPHILDVICSGDTAQKPAIDVVIMSMVLQHLSFWRSLIVYFNHYLSNNGVFLVNEFGKDDYLLGFDVANAVLSTDADAATDLQRHFTSLIDKQFSILSDNNEICATNIDICRHFFDYWGALCEITTEANWRVSVSGEFVKALFSMPMFSPFKRYNSLIGIDGKKISRYIEESSEYEMHFSLHWFLFGKIQDHCARHFDVIIREQMDTGGVCRKLRRYIAEVFETLQANTTIFSLMKSESLACKIVPELFDLLGRFCLFGIGECGVEQLTLFVSGYDTGYVFPLVNSSLCGDVVAQVQLLEEVKQYNVSLTQSKVPSSTELFFNVYKDVFTSPFAVILEPNAQCNQFRDDEFHNGFHYVRLECRSSCAIFSCKTVLNQNGLLPDVFKLLAKQGACIPDKRCALVPCFRENVGIGSNGVGREFTASLIVGYRCDDVGAIRNIEEHLLPFYSWLMRTVVEFSGIGVAIDFVRYEHKVRLANTHSAIGSIMSRNGSHNIGSHVLAALSHNVGTMPDDRVLYQYIQHRMDYIATVTTDFPTWTQPTMFVGELMRDFYSQRHLLDHIAESEGLSAWEFQNPDLSDEETCGQHGKIKLRIRHKRRGASPVEVVNFRKGGEIANMLKEDVALAIPGGVIGNHAFYTILENIIRNAAKHGWSKLSPTDRKEANLEVTIDYEDCKECIEFTIWDNQSDLATDETLLARQKDRIKQPFIDGEGRLRRENWGMAEIKISAGYLAGRAIGEIGGLDQRKEADSQKEDWIVEPCAVRDEIDGKEVLHLGYRFTVEKPRDVVFVLDTAQKEQEELWNLVKERTTEFRASGIVFEPWEEGGKKLTDKTAGKSKFAARYVVLPEFGEAQKIGPWPFRVLTWGKPSACNDLVGQVRLDDIRKILERDGGARSLREEVEKAWLFHLMGKKSLQKDRFAIVVNTEAGESGGGRGLITNADVLRFVFTNGLRTAVETFFETHGGKVSDDTALALWALHALPPPKQPLNVGENDKVVSSIAWELLARLTPLGQEEFRQQCKSRFERSLERLLKRLQGRCPQVLLKRPPNWWEQVKTIQTYLECAYGHPKKEEYGKHRAIFPTWNGCPKNGENLWRQFRGHPHEIAKFVQHLSNVFCEADVFLRKYEERITTLPTGFSTSTRTTGGGAPEDREVCGIKIQSQSIPEESKTEAVFFRHFQPKAENNPSGLIYQEPLSGTQSYFNAIAGMAQDFGGQGDGDVWVAKMAECALLKVCVADERAAKFLRDHPTVRNTYGVENILVLDDKWAEEQLASKEAVPECNPSLASAGNSTPSRDDATGLFQPKEIVNLLRDACGYVRDLRELPPDPPPDGWVRERIEQWQTEGGGLRYTKFREEVVAPNFDILILHQGLIDKWLGETSHLKGHIAVFLGILKLYVKYVVITTGRGTPANIPPRARVLPFPTLESSLFRMYPEKLVLVDTIMNILPVGEESN